MRMSRGRGDEGIVVAGEGRGWGSIVRSGDADGSVRDREVTQRKFLEGHVGFQRNLKNSPYAGKQLFPMETVV